MERRTLLPAESKDSADMNTFVFNSLGLTSMHETNTSSNNLFIKEINADAIDNKEADWLERPENHPIIYMKQLDENLCTGFSTAKGQMHFKKAIQTKYMNIYFTLAPHFQTQCETNLCGVGTLAMILNALHVDPKRMWKYPWRWYDEYMINCCVPVDVMMSKGIDFDGLACAMRCNKLEIEAIRVSAGSSFKKFREDIKRSTSSYDTVLMVNYSRQTFNQTGTGHFSPIGGFNQSNDTVLIMDTARFKLPPHWVKVRLLWRSMQEIAVGRLGDSEDMPRGYYLVKKNEMNPSVTVMFPNRLSIKIDRFHDGGILKQFFHTWNNWLNLFHTGESVLTNAIRRVHEISKTITIATENITCKDLDINLHRLLSIRHLNQTQLYRSVENHVQKLSCEDIYNISLSLQKVLTAFVINRKFSSYKSCTIRRRWRFDKNATVVYGLTALLLCWPYKATQHKNNRLALQNLVIEDLPALSDKFLTTMHQQIYFMEKIFRHSEHENVFCREENY